MKSLFKSMLLLVLLTGVSCHTDERSVNQIENAAVSQNLMLEKSVATGNPYDYLGVLHNEFMQEMHNSKPSDDSEIPTLALKFANSNGFNTSAYDYSRVSAIKDESMNSEFTRQKIDELTSRFQFSQNYKEELYKLADFFNAANYDSTDDIINQLQRIENSYIEATNLTQIEKENLLATIAITRHSTNYWISFFPDDFNSGNNGAILAKRRWWARIFGGIVADAMGAVIGTIGGPAGMIVGAAAASAGVQFVVDDNM